MYNYGPGQSDPGGQFPDNSGNSPYGASQPQYQQDPNAYPQQPQQPQAPSAYPQQPQQPQAPSAYPQQPHVSPTQSYDPSQTSAVPSSPAAPQYGGTAAPTAPVTGPGPLDPTMFGGPGGMLPVPPKKKSPAIPILAGVSALLLVGMVVFLVLFLNTKGDLTEARATIGDNEKEIDDLEGDKKAAEADADKAGDCVKLVEDLFAELDASPDADALDQILDDMETTCKSS